MKQISGLSSIFNRRRSGVKSKTPSPSRRQRDTQQQQQQNPYMSRINIIHTSSNDNNGGHTVSTLTNQDHLFQTRHATGMDSKISSKQDITNKSSPMIRAERKNLLDVDETDTSNATFQHGVDYHLSPREKLWYKNQMYLLEKEKKANSPNHRHRGSPTTTPVSSRYASTNNRNDQYSLSYGEDYKKHSRYSPNGVDEFGQAESKNNVYNRQQTLRHQGSPPSINAPHRRGKMLNQSHESSTIFSEGDTYDDTNQSSTLFGDEEETYDDNTYEEDTFAGDTLEGDTTIGSVTYTTMEGEESLLTESILRPNTYKYELVDDRGQRRYKIGVGASPSSRRRSLAAQQVSSSSPSPRKPTNKRVTIHAPRGRRDDDSMDEVGCPFSEVLEEVQGTMQDAKKSCQQVIYAFVISEDAIDRMSDMLRDAKLELVELYHEQRATKADQRAVHNGQRKFPEYSKRFNSRRDAFR